MGDKTKSPLGIQEGVFFYHNFQGISTAQNPISLETGENQFLVELNNAYCDWQGQIVRDPPLRARHDGSKSAVHVQFYDTNDNKNELAWVEEVKGHLILKAEVDGNVIEFKDISVDTGVSGDVQLAPFGREGKFEVVTSALFNRSVYFFGSDKETKPIIFDGKNFQEDNDSLSSFNPKFGVSVNRRFAIAGNPDNPTRVYLSQIDNDKFIEDDEGTENVLRSGYIDIKNLLTTAEKITGLGSFEQDRLVIFTSDRAFIYRISANFEEWTLESNANIRIGCISHRTIANAGTDLLFCSRSGIHSIKRSEENGILVYSYSLSDTIDLLYRRLYDSVPDDKKEDISAVFDQDEAQYHIFFPKGKESTRLTLSMNPEGGRPQPKFSTGDTMKARCGAFLNGKLVYGTGGGLYDVLKVDSEEEGLVIPEIEIVTPALYHGDVINLKYSKAVIIQASGKAKLRLSALKENLDTGKLDSSHSDTFFVEGGKLGGGNNQYFSPLSRRFERKMPLNYKSIRLRLTSEAGGGLLRITGIAVLTDKKG